MSNHQSAPKQSMPVGIAPGLAQQQERGLSPQRTSGLPTPRRQLVRPSSASRSSLPMFRRFVSNFRSVFKHTFFNSFRVAVGASNGGMKIMQFYSHRWCCWDYIHIHYTYTHTCTHMHAHMHKAMQISWNIHTSLIDMCRMNLVLVTYPFRT